jgi:hypothetical protein
MPEEAVMTEAKGREQPKTSEGHPALNIAVGQVTFNDILNDYTNFERNGNAVNLAKFQQDLLRFASDPSVQPLLPAIEVFCSSDPKMVQEIELIDSMAMININTGMVIGGFPFLSTSGLDPNNKFDQVLLNLANNPDGQQAVESMITPDMQFFKRSDGKWSEVPTGSYTVTFPGDPNHPIHLIPNDIPDFTKDQALPTWSEILKAAFTKETNTNPSQFYDSQSDESAGRLANLIGLNADGPSKPNRPVEQSDYGDCMFEAALQAVSLNPDYYQKLQDMIKSNSDGSYTVTFPGAKTNPITVTQYDLDRYQVKDKSPVAIVLETAFLKLENATPHGGNDAIDFTRAPISDEFGIFKLLTGDFESSMTESTLDAPYLAEIMQSGDVVTASSRPLPAGVGVDDSPSYPRQGSHYPIVGEHQFTVVSFDAKTDTLTLLNPWEEDYQGGALTKPGQVVDGIRDDGDGEISMSLATFEKYFDYLEWCDPSTATQS